MGCSLEKRPHDPLSGGEGKSWDSPGTPTRGCLASQPHFTGRSAEDATTTPAEPP